ncbi:MAG TPA: peptidylprolyl isomerase [Anaerolineaceae bacterium]|nr:peptidylprolyl isomerase [Anaerolineaceae bacterium]
MVFLIAACRPAQPTTGPDLPPQGETQATAPDSTETAPVPTATVTATAEPAAARVNDVEISVREYEAELARFEAAMTELEKTVAPDDARRRVLDSLVDEILLAQAALQSGYETTEADLDARLAQSAADLGGEAAFQTWLDTNRYTLDDYRQALRRSLAAGYQRDQVVAAVPTEVEQVHARQILVLGQEQANTVYQQLESGADFATLVLQYDAVTGGDLGWFPQGYLTVAALEEAAFSLQPGEYSEVIASEFGYHILQVLDRRVEPLSPDARLTLQRQVLQDWLAEQRSNSTIEIFLP